ncbi:hypothetical protein DFH09DRAFT_916783, partial [Mycena vulgaris]
AYRWLSSTYQPGDKIFIFGFSRGAYQVRTLAAIIEKVPGILIKQNRAERIALHFKNTFSRNVRIHFAGLWDTVSSVGLVRGKPLPLTLSAQHICIFRHALALDERRVKFLPEYVAGGRSAPSSSSNRSQESSGSSIGEWDVKEVWFPGSHSDMYGGGNKENLELHLSSVPLLWMENEAKSAGLRLKPRPQTGDSWNISELEKGAVHESLKGFWRFMELWPLKRLTYKDDKAVTR